MNAGAILRDYRVDSDQHIAASAARVTDSMNKFSAYQAEALESLAEALIDGFRFAAAQTSVPSEQAAWRYLQFIASTPPLLMACHQQRFGVAFDFASLGLSDTERGSEGTIEVDRFLEWQDKPPISSDQLHNSLFSWGSGFWYLAWAFGTYTSAGHQLRGLFLELSTLEFWTFPDGIDAVGHLGEWLVETKADLAYVQDVSAALQRGMDTCGESQKGINCALYLQGRISQVAGVDRGKAAALARTHSSALIRFQVTTNDWLHEIRSIDELLEVCDETRSELECAGASSESTREVLFQVLHPVIYNLGVAGAHKDMMRVLAAWNHQPGELDAPQVMIPLAAGGSMVVLPSGLVYRGSAPNLRAIVEAYNEFRKTTIVIRGEDYEPKLPDRSGIVTNDSHARYENAISAVIDNVKISGNPDLPFCIVPLEGHPYQTVMAARTGRMSPWSVSFRKPKPDSQIRKVTILAADDMMADLEAVHVERIFAARGTEVYFVPPSSCNTNAFWDAWCDSSNDVVWLSGHGDFDGLAPEQAHLAIGEDQILFSSIRNRVLPQRKRRRLVVLNVCYGGAAAALEGLGKMGLATSIAGPNQAIASHLWNTHWLSSACFGVILAQELSNHAFFLAFESTCAALREGQDTIEARLRNCGAEDLADRVRYSSLNWSDLSAWGSPCFTQ